jgi:hypothetical protein
MKLRGFVPKFCIHVSVSDFIYSHDQSCYFAVFSLLTGLGNIAAQDKLEERIKV